MTMAATAALRAAIHDALVADTPLTTLLGGPNVYDEPPTGVTFPYVTLGRRASSIIRPEPKAALSIGSHCTPGHARVATRKRTRLPAQSCRRSTTRH